MRIGMRGLGDIVPLNVPSEATQLTPNQGSGWMLQTNGWWIWIGAGAPNLQIPISAGPGIPSNSGWVSQPNQTVVWTGPGSTPNVLPNSITPPGALTTLHVGPTAQGPLFNWTPQPILPDSMLPPVIRRDNQPKPVQWNPTKYDMALISRAKKWQWVAAHGGLKSCCRIPELGAPIWDDPPWEVMPSNAVPIPGEMNGLPIAAFQSGGVFTGLDVLILQIRVPSGYDGVINKFVAQTSGVTGYDDFSGNIIWRLQYGVRYARTLGNVTNTFGSFQNSLLVPGVYSIRVVSDQTNQVFANVPVGSPVAGGSIGAAVFGWFYPRR